MSKAGRIGAILIFSLGIMDFAAILFAAHRSAAEPVRPESAVTDSRPAPAPICTPRG